MGKRSPHEATAEESRPSLRAALQTGRRMLSSISPIFLLYVARGARGVGDGFAIILLPAYLAAIGFDTFQIGFIASAALLGTALLTLTIGFVAPHHDLRKFLLLGAGLMVCTGVLFPTLNHVSFVALLAFFGTINPSSGDIGVLVPLEHAMLAQSASDEQRTRIFARYSLIGALSMAAGSLAAALPDLLTPMGIGPLTAFKLMFYLYAALGLFSASVYQRLPRAEMQEKVKAPLGPSKSIVYKLAALFSIDAFAGGFTVQSLLALWLFQRFGLSLTDASVFFFCATVLSAFSYPVRRLARAAYRAHQYDGFHAHPIQSVSHRGGVLARPGSYAGIAAASLRPVADGCADTNLLCHVGRHPRRAAGSRERDGCSP
jgi:MFS family permease